MRTLLILLALAGFCQAAQAGDISSAYTDLDWKKDCVTYAQAEEGDGDWADLACSGYRGYPVLIAYDDARESLFYGFPPGGDMTTVWESFSGFNSSGAKVEWRIETNGDKAVPFAAIHRRSISNPEDENKPTEVLLVAKVGQMSPRRLHHWPRCWPPAIPGANDRRASSPTRSADIFMRQGQAHRHRQRAGFRPG